MKWRSGSIEWSPGADRSPRRLRFIETHPIKPGLAFPAHLVRSLLPQATAKENVDSLTTVYTSLQEATMAQGQGKMTRGEVQDLVAKFAVENPKYRDALIKDPKSIIEKQLNTSLGKVQVKSVVETPDVSYVV